MPSENHTLSPSRPPSSAQQKQIKHSSSFPLSFSPFRSSSSPPPLAFFTPAQLLPFISPTLAFLFPLFPPSSSTTLPIFCCCVALLLLFPTYTPRSFRWFYAFSFSLSRSLSLPLHASLFALPLCPLCMLSASSSIRLFPSPLPCLSLFLFCHPPRRLLTFCLCFRFGVAPQT